ncbi:MAG: hypothetical protein PHW62_00740 [Candidatus Ratteibacteria bacterium]|nr:hypothetical protein [Candidatus Ratteibacteria bacterium]
MARQKSPYSGISEPKFQRIFDKETYQFHTAVSDETTANKIAEELRKSNNFGTELGTLARVFHLPKSQAKIEFIFSQPHYYRWAIYVKPYKLPAKEAESRTFIHNIIHEGQQEDYINTHYDKMLDDLWDDKSRIVNQKLSIIIRSLGLPWQAPSKYTPTEKKAILNKYRTAKWVQRD